MPLRVAEKDGYVYGVNKCYDCPFVDQLKELDKIGSFWECGNAEAEGKAGLEVPGFCIPVWCPLPIYQMVRQENKMRGKHPENIIWDEPPIFIVRVVEGRGSDTFIEIEPAVPGGPGWTYLRKGDGLMVHDEKGSYGYGVLETPTTSRIRIDIMGRNPKIGERLTLLGPT